MRLSKGNVIEKEKTFGALKFSALHRKVQIVDDEGSVTEQVKVLMTLNLKDRVV